MRTLFLLRHAKSSWKDPALEDHDRPLNKRGKRDAPRIGQLIAERRLTPDLVMCSSARRARDTAFSVLRAAGYEGETRVTRALYHADPESFAELLRGLEGELRSVLVIAHNPGLEELVEALSGEVVELPTAGLAELELGIERWSQLRLGKGLGRLRSLWRPKDLGPDTDR